ncbi:MAG: type I-B CRISPR-associated protein Cas7/Cst2/DevR [Clostridia bacterium]|nr:type I-B CRISPR-associated protein Cas7/Cst2/DevR [Clostridia bacterium]
MKNGLTISMIFEASSANYGEGFGNITTLKKITRDNGEGYSYISRQALRYNMINQLGWDNTPVEGMGSGDKKVIQYQPAASIEDYPEIDLFGYMKTIKGQGAKTRSAVVRLSNAVSLEPYYSDVDFLTNMGLASRIEEDNSIAQSEIHKAFYAYTVTIDLDCVGKEDKKVDEDKEAIEIPNAEKAKRVVELLQTVAYLYRDIKGRRENLAPVFIAGGIYNRKCPFFENRFKLNKWNLDVDMIIETMANIKDDTEIGYVSGTFKNDKEIKESLNPKTVTQMMDSLCHKVEVAYNEGN